MAQEYKVTDWTSWSDAESRPESRPGTIPFSCAFDAVVREMKEKGYEFSGNYHQNGKTGVPVINGRFPFMVSMRVWGDVMARVTGDTGPGAHIRWTYSAPGGEEVVPC